jgi:basic membrane protein A
MRTGFKLAVCATALALAAAACGGDDEDASGASTTAAGGATTTAQPTGDCATKEFVCIGLVTDVGKVDDKSFNESAWNGAKQAAADLKGKADYIETKDSKDYAINIQSFLDKKYDIIVTSGFAITGATITAAKANPTVMFIGTDQFQEATVPNVAAVVFNEDKAGFMAGALAGLLTKSNTVAAVLGTDKIPPVVAYKVGYENGAKHTNPNVKLLSTYHPGGLDKAFVDPEWGAQTSKQALDNGADVVFGAGGKTGNGALEEVAKKSGAFCIGVDSDHWDTVPAAHPCLVTSAMKLIEPSVVALAKDAAAGKMTGGNHFGEVALAPYHDLDSKVPADVKTKIDKIVDDVTAGTLKTGYTPGG